MAALVADGVCTVCVCGPADEQSAKSHAITLGRPLLAFPIAVPNVDEAFAVWNYCMSCSSSFSCTSPPCKEVQVCV